MHSAAASPCSARPRRGRRCAQQSRHVLRFRQFAAAGLYEQALHTFTAARASVDTSQRHSAQHRRRVAHAGDFAAAEEPGRRAWKFHGNARRRTSFGHAGCGLCLHLTARALMRRPIHLQVLNHDQDPRAITMKSQPPCITSRPCWKCAREANGRTLSPIHGVEGALLGNTSPDLALTATILADCCI